MIRRGFFILRRVESYKISFRTEKSFSEGSDMKKEQFNDLLKSVHQMGAIVKGKKLSGMKVTYRAKPATAKEVQKIRKELHLTQEGFAQVVGESPSAIRHCEQGLRNPRGAAAKLIRVLKSHPELVAELR